MTTGFLGRTVDELEVGNENDEFLRMLERLEANAAHPLLIPIRMYSVCSNMLRRQLRQVNWKTDTVQQKTGVLDGYISGQEQPSTPLQTVRARKTGQIFTPCTRT